MENELEQAAPLYLHIARDIRQGIELGDYRPVAPPSGKAITAKPARVKYSVSRARISPSSSIHSNVWAIAAKQSTGHAFETINQARYRQPGWVIDQQMKFVLQKENHEVANKYIPYASMTSWLVEWKDAPGTQWLKDAPSQPLQQAFKDLDRAYKNFFQKRASFPRFKKRGQRDSFRYPQGVK